MGPKAGLDGCGKSRPPPTGIRSPDRPARSGSLYRLSYPGPPPAGITAITEAIRFARFFCESTSYQILAANLLYTVSLAVSELR